MITKIIHYCWFGRKEKPEIVQKSINSWEKFFPDFEIMEWNENMKLLQVLKRMNMLHLD